MKHILHILTLMVFVSAPAKSQNFVIHDVLASSMNAKICDIEIDPYKKRVCWQSSDDDKLWVCRLDTVTWTLTVPDGRETLIDSVLVPITQSSNSGEWGYDQYGTYIVYNKTVARKRYVALALETASGWCLTTLMDQPHRMNPHATQNPNDSVVAFQYISTIWSNFTKYKFRNNLGQEWWIHGFTDAHWTEGEQLLTGILHNHQVGLFDPANPAPPVQLTFDNSKQYSKPYMWHAPEHGNSRMLFANADGEEIQVFKETSPGTNDFRLYMTFASPSSNPLYIKIGSPEPCVYGGQSYITFMASSSECEISCFPGEIWIAKIDSTAPFFRMVSDTSIGVRSDPESLATKDSLLVYYTEIYGANTPEPDYRLRKCDTGIGLGFPTGEDENTRKNPAEPIIYPNPFTNRLLLKGYTGNEHYKMMSQTGKTIWAGKHIERKDFSDLQKGSYILKVRSDTSSYSIGLIKE
jgi:hypothetical protein